MGLSSAEMIGKAIANSVNQSQEIKQDAIPAEIINSMLIAPIDTSKVSVSVVMYSRTISNVLTAEHPVYGEVGAYPVYVPMILGHPVWGVLGSGYLSSSVEYSRTQIGSYP